MYVCVCNAVTERQVVKAIDAGATTVKALSRQLGVGHNAACVLVVQKRVYQKHN